MSWVTPHRNLRLPPSDVRPLTSALHCTTQQGWRAELPDYLLDPRAGTVLRLQLDLNAAVNTCVSRAACVDFLLRRRSLSGLSSESARSELAVATLKVLPGILGSAVCLQRRC